MFPNAPAKALSRFLGFRVREKALHRDEKRREKTKKHM
jgi:hypothetical protein